MKLFTSACVAAVLAACVYPAMAGVTLSQTANLPTAWPVGPDGTPSVIAIQTTANPSSGTTAQTISTGVVSAITFTPAANLKIGAFSIAGNGGETGLSIHLFPLISTYNPATTGGYVPATAAAGPDMLGGGAGLSLTYFGAPDARVLTFDLTGSDEVNLVGGISYAIEIWATGPNTLFVRRGGDLTNNGQIYQASGAGAQDIASTVSRNQVVGARRNAMFTVYEAAAAVPEPSALLPIGLAIPFLSRRRR